MTKVFLVHGAAANHLSWFDVPDGLRAAGHEVTNVLLPAHSTGMFSRSVQQSSVGLQDYVDHVLAAIGSDNDVVLIGHSMGGFVISEVASQAPGKIGKLIYVAAMLPRDAETPMDIIRRAGTSISDVIMEFLGHGFAAMSGLSRQPRGPLRDEFSETPGFQSIPRSYLLCDDDGILPPALQQDMVDARPGTDTVTLASDHLPMLTAPDDLIAALNARI